MADDPDNRGAADRSRINLDEAYEVRYWTQRFGISEEQLRHAVKARGVSAQKVADYFGKTL